MKSVASTSHPTLSDALVAVATTWHRVDEGFLLALALTDCRSVEDLLAIRETQTDSTDMASETLGSARFQIK
jgi:hypothetical protein